jgi:hypothetical protein
LGKPLEPELDKKLKKYNDGTIEEKEEILFELLDEIKEKGELSQNFLIELT